MITKKIKDEIERLIRNTDYVAVHELVMWNGIEAMEHALDYAWKRGYESGSDMVEAMLEQDSGLGHALDDYYDEDKYVR